MPGPAAILDITNTITELKFGKFIDTRQTIDDSDAVVTLQAVEKTWA
jgi:hypothetical protein